MYKKILCHLAPVNTRHSQPNLPSLLISGYSRGLGDQGQESHASLPHWGGVGRTSSGGYGYELHKNRAHCTDAWLVFTREEGAVTWTLAFQGQGRSKEEPERKGHQAWLGFLQKSQSQSPAPLPCLPSTSHCPRESLVPAAEPVLGGGRDRKEPSLLAKQDRNCTLPSPYTRDPDLAGLSRLCS